MIKKIVKAAVFVVGSLLCILAVVLFECNQWPVGSSLAGVILGFMIPLVFRSFQDIFDDSEWKSSLRKLLRARIIKNDSLIRISFAYLYRIKVGDDYLLVRNSHSTDKYQPVGGVYSLEEQERDYLSKTFNIADDNKYPSEQTKYEYRMRVPCKHLKKFVKRFNSKDASRESIENVGREFGEELKGVLKWTNITYRYCGRHMTGIVKDASVDSYKLVLADIVELLPTEEQLEELKQLKLKQIESKKEKDNQLDQVRFVSAAQINNLGTDWANNDMKERIENNSYKILQENEQYLMRVSNVGERYNIPLLTI